MCFCKGGVVFNPPRTWFPCCGTTTIGCSFYWLVVQCHPRSRQGLKKGIELPYYFGGVGDLETSE
uniref:Uncharacterized protein n=1 Tax=Arundo donax TaxID=35708 RepID=A0A0A9A7E5_ARUDO